MTAKAVYEQSYAGFEQGPIRPPSEANSLLIRVTRNCPWNRCTFCPVYKGRRFSLRAPAHVIQDIDTVAGYVAALQEMAGPGQPLNRSKLVALSEKTPPQEQEAFQAALRWYAGGMGSVFLQDANSLILKPDDLIGILSHLSRTFPWIERITSYARSHTAARIPDEKLKAMRRAGLNRIHIGMESGSDAVLQQVKKGTTQAQHIRAGIKVKAAGMALSEYVMPGLGGQALSTEHARETAHALNQINPDFIRLRTLAIPNHVPLFEEYQQGRFQKPGDRMMAQEIRSFLSALDGITSTVVSDHILNLFQEVEGTLPGDKPAMIAVLDRFLNMEPHQQCLYQVGRRLGIFQCLADMDRPRRRARAEAVCDQHRIGPENVDSFIEELMKRFI